MWNIIQICYILRIPELSQGFYFYTFFWYIYSMIHEKNWVFHICVMIWLCISLSVRPSGFQYFLIQFDEPFIKLQILYMHFLCILYAFLMHFLCTSYAFLMHFLCISYAFLMHFLCTSYAIFMHFLKAHLPTKQNADSQKKRVFSVSQHHVSCVCFAFPRVLSFTLLVG